MARFFAKKVHHPGTRGVFFVRAGQEAAERSLEEQDADFQKYARMVGAVQNYDALLLNYLKDIVRKAAAVALEKMKERVLVRTGALRDALKIVERKNEITIEVGGDPATYALVVDSGSRPHVIFPKIKSVLSWEN